MNKVFLAGVVAIVVVASACKKEDNGKAVTRKELLTSTTWKYDTITLDVNKDGNPDTSLPPGYLESCDLDNTIQFNSDMTGISDEGATKCEDSLPQTTSFTWALKNNDSTMTIVGNSDSQLNGDITVKEVTNTTLVLVKAIEITDPITLNANVIVTLVKK